MNRKSEKRGNPINSKKMTTATQIIAAVVAISGLLLSIYTIWLQQQDKETKLGVESQSYVVDVTRSSGVSKAYGIGVVVSNKGEKKAYVSTIQLHLGLKIDHQESILLAEKMDSLEGNNGWMLMDAFWLESGESRAVKFSGTSIIESLQQDGFSGKHEVTVCAWDGIGNKYCDRPLTIDMDEWAKLDESTKAHK
jgi:hypothetical protein